MFLYVLGSIGQWAAFSLLFAGIAIELYYKADIGFIAITSGSVIMVVVTKLKEIGADLELKRMKRDVYKNSH